MERSTGILQDLYCQNHSNTHLNPPHNIAPSGVQLQVPVTLQGIHISSREMEDKNKCFHILC